MLFCINSYKDKNSVNNHPWNAEPTFLLFLSSYICRWGNLAYSCQIENKEWFLFYFYARKLSVLLPKPLQLNSPRSEIHVIVQCVRHTLRFLRGAGVLKRWYRLVRFTSCVSITVATHSNLPSVHIARGETGHMKSSQAAKMMLFQWYASFTAQFQILML